jgi:hypothetical protein
VALTGWGQPEDRERTAKAGFHHHLVKPLEPAALAAILAVLSQKLGETLPLDDDPLLDWSAHVFTAQRQQIVILTNTDSLYSTLFYGRGIANESQFVERALSELAMFLEVEGYGSIVKRLLTPASSSVRLSKALNRSVIGSMNNMVQIATFWIAAEGLSCQDTTNKLNEMPFSSLDYLRPFEAFRGLAKFPTA